MDPMIFVWTILLIVGLALLVKGADFFVDGASGIAKKCRISALVIGLTIVAFGTSAPELCVSVTSSVQGFTDISVGNVVGSNITNILLILGLSALVRPLPVQKNSLKLDFPVLLICSVLIVLLGLWGQALSWWDGLIFLALFALYIALLFRGALKERKAGGAALPNRESSAPQEPREEKPRGKFGAWLDKMMERGWFLALFTLLGLGMVVGGGILLVDNARAIAKFVGVDDRVISLTVVALGTSLPELVTSVVAAKKGETDIAVGNIIGSNIFNILLVAGVASLFHPLAFLGSNLFDALVALAAALLLTVCAAGGRGKLGRAAGIVMLLSFAAYYVALFMFV